MDKDFIKFQLVGIFVVLFVLLLVVIRPNYGIYKAQEQKIYDLTNIVNEKDFYSLSDKEDSFTKMDVFPSNEYPEDKQITIIEKDGNHKTVFCIENHNGLAKVVDVYVDAKQFVFSRSFFQWIIEAKDILQDPPKGSR